MKEKVNTGALRYLGEVSGRTKGNIALLTLIQAVIGVCSVFYALFLQDIINAAVDGDRHTFFVNLIKFVVLIAVQVTLRAIVRFLTELTRATLENRMKTRLFDMLLERDYASVTAVHSGDWMNRLTSDTQLAADGMTTLLPSLVGMVVRIVGAIVVFAMLDRRLLFIIIPAAILLILVSTSFRRVMKRLHKAIRERDGNLRVQMQETLESMLVVRSFGVEDEMSDEAEEKMDDHKAARMKRNRFSNFCTTGFGVIMQTATVLGVAFCGYGILTGSMTYGTFVAVLTLIGQIRVPFQNISGFLPQFYAMLASAERLMEAERLPEGESGEAEPLSDIQRQYDTELDGMGLDTVSFTYPDPSQETHVELPAILSDVSLHIKKGEYVALVGPSGCGKSTLLKLMMCLYTPDCGERYVTLTGRTADQSTHREPLDTRWQRLFAYVPQENQLMSGTIREVVAFPDR
ncbi:MAG: ABC transporter ATP-binding protein/permease, partial [Oscillospiraceae bacterium]|nr:ABC transporter ATP-binding protein/permease [Oscillospiraceae bacterium]